jgi:glycosyltransferase involved in cell wall biosynthesis
VKKYKITIITVTKNSQKFLEKNIKSVLSQSYKKYEHIIVDGNSTDNTLKIIKKYKNQIKFIKNKNDKGLYHAMNVGIKSHLETLLAY